MDLDNGEQTLKQLILKVKRNKTKRKACITLKVSKREQKKRHGAKKRKEEGERDVKQANAQFKNYQERAVAGG